MCEIHSADVHYNVIYSNFLYIYNFLVTVYSPVEIFIKNLAADIVVSHHPYCRHYSYYMYIHYTVSH